MIIYIHLNRYIIWTIETPPAFELKTISFNLSEQKHKKSKKANIERLGIPVLCNATLQSLLNIH